MLDSAFSQSLLFALIAASLGGMIAKKLKLQPLIGYIFSGIILGSFLPSDAAISRLAEIGLILLLFSLGLEFSFAKISKFIKTILLGLSFQTTAVTLLSYPFFLAVGFEKVPAIIFAFGVSLSSTAVLVKILSDKGETDTVHGTMMIGWLLIQDLAVIPAVIILSSFSRTGSPWFWVSLASLFKAAYVILTAVLLGRHVIPFLIHQVALLNSRELLILSSLGFAFGIAYLTYLLGISPSLGAFLAGLVIAESSEKYAIFVETRSLRDLFVAIFFVTLGFMVKPNIIFSHFWLIVGIFVFIILIKTIVDFIIIQLLGYRGKTSVIIGLGLSQVGELSIVIFSLAALLKLVTPEETTIIVAASLLTLLATPFLINSAIPLWRKLKEISAKWPLVAGLFTSGEKKPEGADHSFQDHIIICGYGRVGSWVGKALAELGTPFVIIDYNQKVVSDLRKKGIFAIYGDPAEPEVLEIAGITRAKVVVLAIPDRVSQEMLIGYVQTVAPNVKIISRVHLDEDWERLKLLKVDKVIQPEFEAAVAVTKTILTSMGKSKEEINDRIKKLRISRSLKKF